MSIYQFEIDADSPDNKDFDAFKSLKTSFILPNRFPPYKKAVKKYKVLDRL